ncbi:unnamed protein product [Brachionus calyciflorus]|uniref:Uncharacterized protein n=1 Tax=Brachionus calyciflorus TaxID=104777 RepID=A0A814GBT2_9BILA|nr:unnamed protein product [Brachionus calyciflorus]
MSPVGKKSKNNKFNIYIVEDHNDVLQYIYKEVGSRRLNFSNLTMIHFDSHPDLGIPDINADDVFKKDTLIDSLSIENWIIPAVYAGHISNLVWIKSFWSTQIPNGKYDITIGKDLKTDRIRCDCRESYFTSDNMYSPNQNLTNKKTLNLIVCDFDEIVKNNNEFLENILKNIDQKSLILDIDLDFFSTQDPFKQFFKTNEEYEIFKKVYLTSFKVDKTDPDFDLKYENYKNEKKDKLENIYNFLSTENNNSDNMEGLDLLKQIFVENKIDFELLHSYGSGMDESGLPHHVNNNEDLINMMSNFQIFFQKYFLNLSIQPGIVTIARSSLDDYCPPSQVDFIESETLNILKNNFQNNLNNVNQNY